MTAIVLEMYFLLINSLNINVINFQRQFSKPKLDLVKQDKVVNRLACISSYNREE